MPTDDTKNKLIMKQYRDLKSEFSDLELYPKGDGQLTLAGNLSFTCSHDGNTIKDDYDVEILIPDDYPESPPTAKETSNKIPRDKDNHVNPKDGTLCLGATVATKMKFAKERNLLWFVREQVIAFLFSHSYKRKYGVMPFGELAHGWEGTLEYYKELFSVQDNWCVMGLLKILADDNYRGHTLCPCGSRQKLRDCHGNLLREIKEYQKPADFLGEHLGILKFLNENNTRQNLGEYLPKKVIKEIRNRRSPIFKRLQGTGCGS